LGRGGADRPAGAEVLTRAHITEAESEVLAALWRRGPLSFASLIEEVQGREKWAGATIKTLLNRLMHKGLIRSVREDGRQLYHPQISREDYAIGEIQALADRLFDGKMDVLIRNLWIDGDS
jgi:BlaI family transcriptional regulator, penicillinase repressor